MARIDRSYIGKGEVHLQVRGSGALLPVGNVGELTVSFEEDKKEQLDYTSPGGGAANALTRITSFTGSMKLFDISAENMALALRGAVTQVASGAVTDEAHDSVGVEGELIPFDFLPDLGQTVTVKTAGNAALVAGTDYELTRVGIKVLDGSGIDATGVLVSYTKTVQEVMQALVSAGKEFRLVLNGLNEAQSGKAVNITLHRVKFSPAQGLNFIGDDFAEMDVAFDVLSDAAITSDVLSKFMKVSMAL